MLSSEYEILRNVVKLNIFTRRDVSVDLPAFQPDAAPLYIVLQRGAAAS